MDVVVVGAGEVGSSIAETLDGNHHVVVIDRDPDRVESIAHSHDVLTVEGDATMIEPLEEAAVDEADLVIASTDDDKTNLVICGAAKAVGDPFAIARVTQTHLLRVWERGERTFDVDFMVSSDLHSAEAIVNITELPGVRDADSFADGLVRMAEFVVDDGSPIADRTVADADRFDLLTFAAIVRDETVVVPSGETLIRTGDRVIVIGSVESVRAFASSSSTTPTPAEATDVVIVGGSEIGYQTARLFEADGIEPRLIERDPDRARELAERLPKTLVLESDATDIDFLVEKHVDESDIVVATLDRDERNLLVSLLAKRLGVERTIGLVDSTEYVDLFETVGIDVTIHPRLVTAEEITRITRKRQTENLTMLEHASAEILEIELDCESALTGIPIQDAMADLPDRVVIGTIVRDGELLAPRGETVLESGDYAVIFVDTDVLDEVTGAI